MVAVVRAITPIATIKRFIVASSCFIESF